ncbi:unnamed protein product [Owenia fusiformis]|uniref:Uncharacterized protein n=1 Tax=Owenia fusiformis TaxID=6347 RepID=A0A8J1U2Z4_OWEFU|nr:unnamed protein product [Owenia fusiformis]
MKDKAMASTWIVLTFSLLWVNVCVSCWPSQPFQSRTPKIKVRPDGHFVDPQGRVRMFHGFNKVEKGFPWYPASLLNETRLKLYEDWGFNAVRLGTMWAGAYPAKDQVNQTYMNTLGEIIDKLGNHGMYSILDMHQDVLTSKYKAYDGVPLWLIDMFPEPKHSYPWPLPSISQWAEGYLTEAVSSAFGCLYNNTNGALNYYTDFWKTVARQYMNKDSVLAYELMNEPWAGDIYEDPTLILPGRAGFKNLLPMWDWLADGIRKVDENTIIMYEPVTWAIYLHTEGFGTGFGHVPGGYTYKDRSALSYHYYCQILSPGDDHKPYPHWKQLVCDEVLLEQMFQVIKESINDTGGGGFLTEFGQDTPDSSANHTSTEEMSTVLDHADKNLQSWTYWDSQFFWPNGTVDYNVVKLFSRTYAQAIAGTPTFQKFDFLTGDYTFEYMHDPTINAPTELYVPTLHYPIGFNVTLTPGLKWSYEAKVQRMLITLHSNDIIDGPMVPVSLKIKAK